MEICIHVTDAFLACATEADIERREAAGREDIPACRALFPDEWAYLRVVAYALTGTNAQAREQNVHHFRDEALRGTTPPIDPVTLSAAPPAFTTGRRRA